MKKILFYYPQHFNRSKKGTNPFFDQMLAICNQRGIAYDLFEEPDGATDKPRNPLARKADTFYWMVTFIRKLTKLFFPKKDFFAREKYVAKAVNILTFGYFRRPVYITISGSMYHLFSYLNPKAPVFDMQHGVLGKFHPTFFDKANGRLFNHFNRPNLHFLFWGEGYRDCFVRGEEAVLEGRTHVVGYPIDTKGLAIDPRLERNIILVSLQFTHSVTHPELENMKSILDCFLSEVKDTGVKVLLKHHPRYNNCISLDEILAKHTDVELTDAPLDELIKRVFLHITHFSTTAFEFAQTGIPTFFLTYEDKTQEQTLFYDEYKYPLYRGQTIGDVVRRLQSKEYYMADSLAVKNWYTHYYTPFDVNEFQKIIQTESNLQKDNLCS